MYLVYETLQRFVYLISLLSSFFISNSKFRRFLKIHSYKEFLIQIEKAKPLQECYWIHVASAGELEQAIPLMRTLVNKAEAKFFLTYFSPSAEPFIKNAPGLIGSAGIPLDIRSRYLKFIRKQNITKIFFVRYDIWPGMCAACLAAGVEMNLLAATSQIAKAHFLRPLFSKIRAQSFLYFKHIFAVTEADVGYFKKIAPDSAVHLAGDPKWFRAKERVDALATQSLSEKFGGFYYFCQFQKLTLQRRCFVFGSPHEAEIEVAIRLAAHAPTAFIILAPGEIDDETLTSLERQLKKFEVPSVRYTHLEKVFAEIPLPVRRESLPQEFNPEWRVVLFDRMGSLAELYAFADAAVVGGGFDGQIHNVLEPAAHPVATLYGSKVARAAEAKALAARQAGLTFDSTEEMFEFLMRCARLGKDPQNESASLQKLAATRLAALEIFEKVPNTTHVVLEALFRK